MTPTIGRIVMFRNDKEVNGVKDHPAIITRVWSDTCVNLHVFFDANPSEVKTSVTHGEQDYNWYWPHRKDA